MAVTSPKFITPGTPQNRETLAGLPVRTMAVIWLIAIATAGCSGTNPVRSTAPSQADASTAQLEAAYWARQNRAKTFFTKADVEFMTGMISHHAQALVMSRLAPTHGASDQLLTLTSRIINAQQDEIVTMQTWLRDREQPVPEIEIDGLKLVMRGTGDHAMHMPGMLTQDQLRELDESRGPDFDRLFLTYMIQHHSGAVSMVDDLFKAGGADRDDLAFKLASDINVDQITEIARMERMLNAMTGSNGDS
jgi:uncharacterized protein (DUF305 family)